MTQSALLVVDVQRDVVDVDAPLDAAVVGRVAELVERARADGVDVIWVQHAEPGMEQGDAGWQLAPPLAVRDGEALVHKRFRSAFVETDLDDALTDLGIERVIICGAQSDYCVRTTLQAAVDRGYDTTLVADAHTTADLPTDAGTIGAAQLVAHTNSWVASWTAPGARVDVVAAADLRW